jgi:hypothetical protein
MAIKRISDDSIGGFVSFTGTCIIILGTLGAIALGWRAFSGKEPNWELFAYACGTLLSTWATGGSLVLFTQILDAARVTAHNSAEQHEMLTQLRQQQNPATPAE